MAEQIERKPLQYFEGYYVGKVFTTDFGNGNKGYKFMFKVNPTDKYEKNFFASNTTKGYDILEEGNQYKIGYVEAPSGQYTIKKARFFGEVTGQSSHTPKSETPQSTLPSSTDKFSIKEFETFILNQYFPSVTKDTTSFSESVSLWVGTVLGAEKIDELKGAYKKRKEEETTIFME
ncbi:MAG: hypothetical protein R3250_04080 [Melioribacteraceae bacterium]|nr:hypothetical protein [Melioribacteraceae bacterium]